MRNTTERSKWRTGVTTTLIALLAMACSEQGAELPGEEREAEKIPLTFEIGTPESDEVIYSRATDDENSKRVETMTVYDFAVQTEAGTGKKSVVLRGAYYLTKVAGTPQTGEFGTSYNSTTGAMVVTCRLLLGGIRDPKTEVPHHFVFVANEGKIDFDMAPRPGVTPIDELLRNLSTRILVNKGSCDGLAGSANSGAVMTMMTGETAIASVMAPASLPKLCRVMARIDVTHNMKKERYLKIVSIEAKNCAARGYLFGTTYDGSPTTNGYDYTSVITVASNSTVQTKLTGLQTGETCENVFYLYEQPGTQNGKATPTPTLVLNYTMNGAPNTVEVPIQTTAGARIDLKRNTRYRLMVGEEAGTTRVVCTIETAEVTETDKS